MTLGLELAALGGLSLALVVLGVWVVRQVRERNPERREQKRRQFINQRGRLGDALITDVSDSVIYYAYSVHGVQYTASQDVTGLRDRLPDDPQRLIGVANLKYAVRNPANSILLCEEWSGLRKASADRDVPAAS